MKLSEQINEDLKPILSEKRYIHSVGVMEMAAELAKIYNVDEETARVAGILHDIAKEMPKEEMLEYVEKNNIEITEVERINTSLLHGKIGADIAKKKYNVSKEIQDAISYHTTTNPNMGTLAKIIYVSDKIELNRVSDEPELELERKMAKQNLDETVLFIINTSIKYLVEHDKLISPECIMTRNKLMMN